MYKKTIFIGSSSEAKPYAKKIAATLERLGCITMPWWEAHVFPAGEYTFDSILYAAHSVDAGLFLLAEDDTTHSRGRAFATTRNNVLLEAGLFYGVLGRNGVGLCVDGMPEIPSDWDGITLLRFNAEKMNEFEECVNYWLQKVKYRNNKKKKNSEENKQNPDNERKPNNVYMESREKIHKQYLFNERLGGDVDTRKHITEIKILSFTSNLLINPELPGTGGIPEDKPSNAEVMLSVIEQSKARIELILAKPTDYVLKDIITKLASKIGPVNSVYSAQNAMYELLTGNRNESLSYQKAYKDKRFHYKVTELCIPFAIFAVKYDDDYHDLNHVKVDLYSAALSDENNKRSMIIWQNQDEANYTFFIKNFDDIYKYHSEIPSMEEMKIWSDKWKGM